MFILIDNCINCKNKKQNFNFLKKFASKPNNSIKDINKHVLIVSPLSNIEDFKIKILYLLNKNEKIVLFLSGSNNNIDSNNIIEKQIFKFNKDLIQFVQFYKICIIAICYGSQVIYNLLNFKINKIKSINGFISVKNNNQSSTQLVYAHYSRHFKIDDDILDKNKKIKNIKKIKILKIIHDDNDQQQVQLAKVCFEKAAAYCFTFHPESLLTTHSMIDEVIRDYF